MKLLSISEGAGLQVYMNNIIDWQDQYGDLGRGFPVGALCTLSPSWHVKSFKNVHHQRMKLSLFIPMKSSRLHVTVVVIVQPFSQTKNRLRNTVIFASFNYFCEAVNYLFTLTFQMSL